MTCASQIFKALLVIAGVFVALLLFASCAALAGSANKTTLPPVPTTTQQQDGRHAADTSEGLIPGSIGELRVGTDVRPGRYRSAGGEGCYWARLESDDQMNGIIANGTGPGVQVVTIERTDRVFLTTNCEDWRLIR